METTVLLQVEGLGVNSGYQGIIVITIKLPAHRGFHNIDPPKYYIPFYGYSQKDHPPYSYHSTMTGW